MIRQSFRCEHAIVLILAAAVLSPANAAAQSPVISPAATGMGHGAYDVLACGPDALSANPAALARDCVSQVRVFPVPALAVEVKDNGAGGEIWRNRRAILDAIGQQSFEGGFEGAAGEQILARIPAEGYRHSTQLHFTGFQIGLGARSAMSLTFSGANHGVIARDLAELKMGYEEGRTAYSIANTDEWATAYWTLALGHGRTFGGFHVGVTARAISGTLLTRWRAFDPHVDVDEQQVSARVIGAFAGENVHSGDLLFGFRRPDGFGWGVDVGAMRDVGPLRIGFAIQNLAHAMTWNEEIHLRTLALTATVDGAEFDSHDSVFDPATASSDERHVAADLRADAYFPRRMRASAAFTPSRVLTLGLGAVFNENEGALGRDWDQRYSAGALIQPVDIFRVVAGLAMDLDGALELSGGLELDLARTRLGLGAVRITEPDDMGGWRVALGISRF